MRGGRRIRGEERGTVGGIAPPPPEAMPSPKIPRTALPDERDRVWLVRYVRRCGNGGN